MTMIMSRRETSALPGVKSVSGARKRTIFAKGCHGKNAPVYAIEGDEDQEKIIVVRVQAMKD